MSREWKIYPLRKGQWTFWVITYLLHPFLLVTNIHFLPFWIHSFPKGDKLQVFWVTVSCTESRLMRVPLFRVWIWVFLTWWSMSWKQVFCSLHFWYTMIDQRQDNCNQHSSSEKESKGGTQQSLVPRNSSFLLGECHEGSLSWGWGVFWFCSLGLTPLLVFSMAFYFLGDPSLFIVLFGYFWKRHWKISFLRLLLAHGRLGALEFLHILNSQSVYVGGSITRTIHSTFCLALCTISHTYTPCRHIFLILITGTLRVSDFYQRTIFLISFPWAILSNRKELLGATSTNSEILIKAVMITTLIWSLPIDCVLISLCCSKDF